MCGKRHSEEYVLSKLTFLLKSVKIQQRLLKSVGTVGITGVFETTCVYCGDSDTSVLCNSTIQYTFVQLAPYSLKSTGAVSS